MSCEAISARKWRHLTWVHKPSEVDQVQQLQVQQLREEVLASAQAGSDFAEHLRHFAERLQINKSSFNRSAEPALPGEPLSRPIIPITSGHQQSTRVRPFGPDRPRLRQQDTLDPDNLLLTAGQQANRARKLRQIEHATQSLLAERRALADKRASAINDLSETSSSGIPSRMEARRASQGATALDSSNVGSCNISTSQSRHEASSCVTSGATNVGAGSQGVAPTSETNGPSLQYTQANAMSGSSDTRQDARAKRPRIPEARTNRQAGLHFVRQQQENLHQGKSFHPHLDQNLQTNVGFGLEYAGRQMALTVNFKEFFDCLDQEMRVTRKDPITDDTIRNKIGFGDSLYSVEDTVYRSYEHLKQKTQGWRERFSRPVKVVLMSRATTAETA